MPQESVSHPRSLDTVSVWALLITLIVALFIFIPSDSIPFVATKTFVLAAGALVTLALYILARLSRGNVIFPPSVLVLALWLPVLAYALSTAFSGIPFNNALWGSALEPDTLGFMLVAAVLGTVTALIVRRVEHFQTFLRTSAIVFCAVVAVEVLVLIVGQVSPATVSPAFSILGSYDNLAAFLGLGLIGILLALRFLTLSAKSSRILIGGGVGALLLLAVANARLVWILIALVSLGLFVESVMRRSKGMSASDADLDDVAFAAADSAPLGRDEGGHSLILPLATLAISLFFLIGGTLGTALADTLNVSVLSVRPSAPSASSGSNTAMPPLIRPSSGT